jgi:hypothetical protein
MQKKLLTRFFHIIPIENPRLDLKTYTKMFEHLYSEVKDYETLKDAVQRFPKYLINHE